MTTDDRIAAFLCAFKLGALVLLFAALAACDAEGAAPEPVTCRAVVELGADTSGVSCLSLADPEACCPAGFEWVGTGTAGAVVCLEVR